MKEILPTLPETTTGPGRPTDYKPEYAEQLIEFFSEEANKEIEIHHSNSKSGHEWTEYEQRPNPLPTFTKFAKKIGVHDNTLMNWANATNEDGSPKHPEFLCAYTRAQELYKDFIVENGLNNLYNPTFAIFVMKNTTDWKDKTEVDANVKTEKVVSDEEANDLIAEALAAKNAGS